MTQLPLGQIRSAAQPVSAFFQPGQANVAAATAQPGVPRTPQIDTIQERGGINVQGYNSFQQLAESLQGFSKQALAAGKTMALNYVQGKVQEGYQAEMEARNQANLAVLNLQNDYEAGSADAINEINELQRVDPEAAQLLTDSNPYRLIGRRRAAAQLLAHEIKGAFEADLAVNAPILETIVPGSPQLAKRKSDIARAATARFGLTGNEPEYVKYVSNVVNRAGDSYTTSQANLYNKAVGLDAEQKAVAELGMLIAQYTKQGVLMPAAADGSRPAFYMKRNHPDYLNTVHALLTIAKDKHFQHLTATQRSSVSKKITEQLYAVFNDDLSKQVLDGIRMGNPNMPYESRPLLGFTVPFTSDQQRAAGLQAQVNIIQNRNQLIQQNVFENFYDKRVGPQGQTLRQLDPIDDRAIFEPAVDALVDKARQEGHTDPVQLKKDLIQRARDAQENQVLYDPKSTEDFKQRILNELKIGDFVGDDGKLLRADIEDHLAGVPFNLRDKARTELFNAFSQMKQKADQIIQYVGPATAKSLEVVVAHPAIKTLLGRTGGLLAELRVGAQTAQGKYLEAFSEVGALDLKNQIDEGLTEAGLAALREADPADIANFQAIAQKAQREYLNSPAFNALVQPYVDRLNKQKTQNNVPQGNRPETYERNETSSLSDEVIGNYAKKPVMSGKWVVSELQREGFSPELEAAAKRADVSPARFLHDHIHYHYPQIDKDNKIRRQLLLMIEKDRKNKTVSFNQPGLTWDGSKIERVARNLNSPGGWLADMLFAGYMTPADRQMLRDYAEQMRRLGTPAAIEELKKMNIRYRNYGMHFPLA